MNLKIKRLKNRKTKKQSILPILIKGGNNFSLSFIFAEKSLCFFNKPTLHGSFVRPSIGLAARDQGAYRAASRFVCRSSSLSSCTFLLWAAKKKLEPEFLLWATKNSCSCGGVIDKSLLYIRFYQLIYVRKLHINKPKHQQKKG